VPSAVADFIFDLYIQTRTSHQLDEIELLYQTTYPELCEQYFNNTKWPAAEEVETHFSNDELFKAIYLEMRSRHMFASNHIKPTLKDRLEVWDVYCSLFDKLLACDDADTVLTTNWTFEILHEFVYQYQSFAQFRTSLEKRSDDDIQLLRENPEAWNCSNVLNYLSRLVQVSKIREILRAKRAEDVEVPQPPSSLHEMMGYFALICQSRLECLLGDYFSSLRCVDCIDFFDQNELFRTSIMAHTSLFYHTGFCYLMLRRYADAARLFSSSMAYINRLNKQGGLPKGYDGDQIVKTADKMLTLTAVMNRMIPGLHLSGEIKKQLQLKPGEKNRNLDEASEQTVKDQFVRAGPKFVSHAAPDYSTRANYREEVQKLQTSIFAEELRSQDSWPKIRSILRLYTTIGVTKLATFAETDPEDLRATLNSLLVRMTHRASPIGSDTTAALAESECRRVVLGTGAEATDVTALEPLIHLVDDMVYVHQKGREDRYEDFFLQQLLMCKDVQRSLM